MMDSQQALKGLLENRPSQVRVLGESPARFGEVLGSIHGDVEEWLKRAGFESFYLHQASAIDAALAGKDVMVVTGTSSGKTLCYNVPVLHRVRSEPLGRALYLFPTKALANDQLGKLEELVPAGEISVASYDGDTPKHHRAAARSTAQIVLTNPDMLHLGILPQHELWTKFLRSLRVVVVDEAHVYRGVFGGHMGWILRRLMRLCEWHGNRPQIIAASATVANPLELFEDLTGRSAVLVDRDGAPKGEKAVFVVEAPDTEDPKSPSPNLETAGLVAECVMEELRVMAFCQARVSVELVMKAAREKVEQLGGHPEWIESYRGGYTAEERRGIEKRLFNGDLRGLVTTNAMELGVDVGGLDVVVLNGYPGRRASFWQQVGRAGRSGRSGAAVFLAHADPLQQFMARDPDRFLMDGAEPVRASVRNPYVVGSQLRCAAFERPLGGDEVADLGVEAELEGMVAADDLREAQGRYFYPAYEAPAGKVNIRGSAGDEVRLVLAGEVLGTMEFWRALQSAHEGAVYLHRGESYLVRELDVESRVAFLEKSGVDYFTRPIVQSVVEPGVVIEDVNEGLIGTQFLGVEVTTAVTGFRKLRINGQVVVGEEELELPPQSFDTMGVRWDFDPKLLPIVDPESVAVVHTLEHLVGALAPLRAGCDRRDLGTAWYAVSVDTMGSALYLFDDTPGGLGLSEEVFRRRWEMWGDALAVLRDCGCVDGCPLCVLSPGCECGNEPLSKQGARGIIEKFGSAFLLGN